MKRTRYTQKNLMMDDYENYPDGFVQETEYSMFHPEDAHELHGFYRGNPRDEIWGQDKAQSGR